MSKDSFASKKGPFAGRRQRESKPEDRERDILPPQPLACGTAPIPKVSPGQAQLIEMTMNAGEDSYALLMADQEILDAVRAGIDAVTSTGFISAQRMEGSTKFVEVTAVWNPSVKGGFNAMRIDRMYQRFIQTDAGTLNRLIRNVAWPFASTVSLSLTEIQEYLEVQTTDRAVSRPVMTYVKEGKGLRGIITFPVITPLSVTELAPHEARRQTFIANENPEERPRIFTAFLGALCLAYVFAKLSEE